MRVAVIVRRISTGVTVNRGGGAVADRGAGAALLMRKHAVAGSRDKRSLNIYRASVHWLKALAR